MNYTLCKEFPSLSPFDIDSKSYHDVIVLFGEVRTLQKNIEKEQKRNTTKDGRRIIRRPASDNWF